MSGASFQPKTSPVQPRQMKMTTGFFRALASVATLFIAGIVLVPFAGSRAQETSPANEPRFPKAIHGLDSGQEKPPSARWLRDAKDDEERFRRLEIYAGGTYEQMWQIGYRYQQVYQAIVDRNWELGHYHWRKLRDVFNVALMKRPNRTPNAEAIFLDSTWKELEAALEAKDPERAQRAFLRERDACMSCHVAEKLPFLNDTPIFRDTAAFPASSR